MYLSLVSVHVSAHTNTVLYVALWNIDNDDSVACSAAAACKSIALGPAACSQSSVASRSVAGVRGTWSLAVAAENTINKNKIYKTQFFVFFPRLLLVGSASWAVVEAAAVDWSIEFVLVSAAGWETTKRDQNQRIWSKFDPNFPFPVWAQIIQTFLVTSTNNKRK